MPFPGNGHVPLIVDKPLVCGRGLPGRLSSHCSSIQHGRPTPSHRPALTLARCSAPADFASLRVLGAPAASRPPLLTSSLVALPASLGSSYRPALRWPGIPGLRSASRCPRPFTPSGLRRQRPVSRTARGLRAPRRRRPSVPALRTALAFGGAVFRRCGRLLGVSSRLQPLCGLRLRTACARASSRFAASNGSDRDGNAFLPTVRNRRSTSHAKRACGSCCSLGLLRPVSATGGGLRAHPQFAMVVLLRLTACSTPLLIGLTSACFAHCARPSCAPQKMPEMTYTPSFLIRASFFRDFVNTLRL